MKKEREIVWEDSKQKPSFLVHFFVLVLIIIFVFGLLVSWGSLNSLWLFLLTIIFFLLFLSGFRVRYVVMEKRGIWSGNNTGGQMINKMFILKQKNTFVLWNYVDKFEIKEKEVYFSYVSNKSPFLIIHTKDNKVYECVIVDVKGFKDALRKLNKLNLLIK